MADFPGTDNKPCSVQARQGFSVYYRNRYLYSQYDAEKPVTRLIDSLSLRPETLLLAYSPALGTGLLHLLERLPEDSHILAVEFDPALFSFFMATDAAQAALNDPRFTAVLLDRPERIAGLLADSAAALSEAAPLDKADSAFKTAGAPLPSPGFIRRALPVEMSGGTAFNADAFRLTTKYADDSIATFWKNHITLTRLGRLYAKNLLTNAALVSGSEPPASAAKSQVKPDCRVAGIAALKPHSVTKPLLALGAGPSLDELLPHLSSVRDSFFILAADAALPALAQHGVRPDAVVAVESQIAIEKAYIGFAGSGIPLIADMTSRPRVLSILQGPVSFFMTRYCNEPFMNRFEDLARENGIPVFQPLGSVGLYALELALYLRKEATPVTFSGLDFAWGKGSTHCKGAPAHTNALLNASRLNPAGNPAAAFGAGTVAFNGKGGSVQYTTPNLSGYSMLLAARYKNTPLLTDAGRNGMETGIPHISVENLLSDAKKRAVNARAAENDTSSWMSIKAPVKADTAQVSDTAQNAGTARKALAFLAAEFAAIKQIVTLIDDIAEERNALADKAAESCCPSSPAADTLRALLEDHSYLYLHFPDSARGPSLTPDFLARVKAEASRFLK